MNGDEKNNDLQENSIPPGGNPKQEKGDDTSAPAGLEQILEKVPEPERRQLLAFFSSTFTGPPQHPLAEVAKKVTSEHVGKLIENDREESSQRFKEKASVRQYAFISFVIIVLFTAALVYTFKEKPTVLTGVLSAVGGIVGGGSAGYGLGLRQSRG